MESGPNERSPGSSRATKINATLTVKPQAQPYPDLIIQDFSWSPSGISPGTATAFSYIVKSQGEASASLHQNALYIDGDLFAEDEVSSIAAGAFLNRTFPKSWTAVAGPHVIVVKADSNNWINEGTEEREKNNSKDKTLGSKIATQLTVQVSRGSVPPTGGTLVTVSGKLTRTNTSGGLAS